MNFIDVISNVPFTLKVGDPNPLAWATVAAYLLAAIGSVLCSLKADKIFQTGDIRIHRIVWGGLGAGFLFLGINKQADFQTWFTAVVKALAHHWNVYETAKRFQWLFVVALAVVSVGTLLIVAWHIRREWRRYALLLLGAVFIVRFVIVRVSTFYGIHLPPLSELFGGLKLNWLLEIVGALAAATAAFFNWRSAWKRKKHA
ncbi:MAG: hypothetical protein JXX29_09210 [Deltaproteobacteria bacterium]|nr:hypothetical protein [Deltaproteobacteria bacterium]MBN2671841.1 hypothetical protein [Deltaproteobacteria bacterium]